MNDKARLVIEWGDPDRVVAIDVTEPMPVGDPDIEEVAAIMGRYFFGRGIPGRHLFDRVNHGLRLRRYIDALRAKISVENA